MKILSIKLQNINSISGEYTIHLDRPPLKDEGLFLISGSTGAGKSTILDAITLALFNQIPRNQKEKNPIHVMTHGKDNSYCGVRFSMQEKIYLAEWFCTKRQKKSRKDGSISEEFDIERKISEEDENGTFITLASGKKTQVAEKIDEILLGLTFDQFCRSILLAQGEFARLLKEDTKTRSEILERITNMEQYATISQAAHQRVSAAKKDYEAIKEQLQQKGVELLSENEVTQLQNEILALKTHIESAEQTIQQLQQQIQALEQAQYLQIQNLQLENALEEALASVENIDSILEALRQHDLAAPYLVHLDRKTHLEEDLQKVKSELQILEHKVADFDHTFAALNEERIQSEAIYLQQKTYIQEQEIIWTQASKYDQEIALAAQQLASLQALAASNAEKMQSNAQAISKYEMQIQKLKNQLATEQTNLQNLSQQCPNDLSDIKTDYAQMLQLDKQLEPLRQKLNTLTQQELENKNKQQSCLQKTQSLSAQKKALQEEYNAFLKQYQLNFDDYQLLNLDKLEKRLAQSDQFLKDINSVITLQEDNQLLFSKYEALEAEINLKKEIAAKLEIEYQQLSQAQSHILNAIAIAEKDLSALRKQHEKQAFLIEAVQYRQKHLHIGENCPVCTQVCKEIPQDLADELNTNLQSIMEHLQTLQHTLEQAQKDLQNNQHALRNIEQKQHFNLQEQEQVFHESKRLYQEYLNNQNTAFKLLAHWNMAVESQQDIDIVFLLEAADNFKKEQADLKQALQKAQNWRSTYENVCQRLRNEEEAIQQFKAIGNNIVVSLNETMTEGKKIRRDKDQKLQNIGDFLQTYGQDRLRIAEGLQQLEENIKQYSLLKEKVNEIKHAIENEKKGLEYQLQFRQEYIDKDTDLQKEQTLCQQNILKKQNARHAILALENSPNAMRDKAQIALNIAEENYKKQAAQCNHFQNSFATWQGQIQSLSENQKNKIQELTQILAILQKGVEDLGLENIAALQSWILPNAQTLRESIKTQQIKIEQLQNQLAENKGQLASLPIFEEREYGILKDKKVLLNNEIKAAYVKIGNIETTLARFEKDQAAHAQLLAIKAEREAELQRWERIDKLIGSSDGKKFRVFAQSITLRNLVAYANKHLAQFLDGRYRLRQNEPYSMELSICDTFRADNIRTLNSLSGGETFLVSLALALALADLAGTNIKFESLFIDEGFGSLDNETLNLALRVLNQLQQKGKTIGIISHVEMLQATIPTQIKVISMGSGLSKIIVP